MNLKKISLNIITTTSIVVVVVVRVVARVVARVAVIVEIVAKSVKKDIVAKRKETNEARISSIETIEMKIMVEMTSVTPRQE